MNIPDGIDGWDFDFDNTVVFYHDSHVQMKDMKSWFRSFLNDEVRYVPVARSGPSGPYSWWFELTDNDFVMLKIVLSITEPSAPPLTF